MALAEALAKAPWRKKRGDVKEGERAAAAVRNLEPVIRKPGKRNRRLEVLAHVRACLGDTTEAIEKRIPGCAATLEGLKAEGRIDSRLATIEGGVTERWYPAEAVPVEAKDPPPAEDAGEDLVDEVPANEKPATRRCGCGPRGRHRADCDGKPRRPCGCKAKGPHGKDCDLKVEPYEIPALAVKKRAKAAVEDACDDVEHQVVDDEDLDGVLELLDVLRDQERAVDEDLAAARAFVADLEREREEIREAQRALVRGAA